MSLNRYAARRDKVEHDLVKLAKKLGAMWVKAGPLDGWIGRGGVWVPVEIKSPRGQHTRLQKQFLSHCMLSYLPAWTWRSEEDVLKCLHVLKTP